MQNSPVVGRRKKILFHTGSLKGGGAQRVIVTLLRELDRERFEGYLVLWEREGVYFDLLPSDVPVYAFAGGPGSRRHNIAQLGQIIEQVQPDVVMSFLDGANVLALEARLLKRSGCSFLISQRNNLSVSLERNYPYSALRRWFKKRYMAWLYPKADHIITLSDGVKTDLMQNFNIPTEMITPIYNPVDLTLIKKRSLAAAHYPWPRGQHEVILGVGRLIEQKGFSDLIRAFSQVRESVLSKLMILGEGVLRSRLEALVASLNLQGDVHMPGFVDNPWAFMRDADLFVLSSHWEGLGNVIIEAMACGTPVVATDCDFGPREVIQHGKNGILVPVGDVERLAEQILLLLHHPEKREQLAEAGFRRSLDFNGTRICREYEKVFEQFSPEARAKW
jgi:glycosyltransferase involved in cell wall biosynthesis